MAAPVVASSGAHSTTATCDAPAGVQSGDLVIVVATDTGNSTAALMTLSGFTEAVQQLNDLGVASPCVAVFWKKSNGSEPSTYTVSGGSQFNTQAHRITGADADSPIRATTSGTGSGSSTPSLSLSSLVTDDLVIYADGGDQNRQMTTLPSGSTRLTDAGVNRRQHAAYKAQTSDGDSGSFSGGMNSSANHATVMVAIKPLAATPAQIGVTFPAFTAALTLTQNTGSLASTFPKFVAALTATVANDALQVVWPKFTAAYTVQQTTTEVGVTFPKFGAVYTVALSVPTQVGVTWPKFSPALSGGVESRISIGVTWPKFTVALVGDVPAPPNWQQVVRSTAYLTAAGERVRTVGCRVDMIDNDDLVVASIPITGGTVDCNSTVAERWQASITLGDSDYMPSELTDLLHPLSGLRARIWWTIVLPSGFVAEVPVGTYYVSNPAASRSSSSFGLQVRLLDIISRVRRNKWGTAEVINLGGQSVTDALRTVLANRAPAFNVRVTETDQTLPEVYEVGQVGRDPWSDVLAIADAAAFTVYSDRLGGIIAEPRATLDNAPTVLGGALSVGEDDCRMESINRSLDETQLLNRLTVRSTSPEIDPPVYATVEDNDPASPLWVGNGFIYSDVIDSDSVTTEAACRTLAEVNLAERRALIESVDLVHRPRPEVDPGNLIRVDDPKTGASGLYQIAAWAVSLEPGAMQRTVATDRRIPV